MPRVSSSHIQSLQNHKGADLSTHYLPHVDIGVGRVSEREHGGALFPADLVLEDGGDVGSEAVGICAHLTTIDHLPGSLLLNAMARLDEARVEMYASITSE